MGVIDAHVHFADVQSLRFAAELAGIDYTSRGLNLELDRAGVELCVCMGIVESGANLGRRKLLATSLYPSPNPMLPNLDATLPTRLAWCPGVNPVRLNSEEGTQELTQLEAALGERRCVGLKLYPGYFPYPPQHRVYEPVFDLAAQHELPVVVHTGETYAYGADDSLAHPSGVAEAARAHPDVSLVMAHLGYPWIDEALEAARRTPNLVLELSGLVEGGGAAVEEARGDPELRALTEGLIRFGDFDRVIFGTDWPLVPIGLYLQLMAELIPTSAQERVFFANALRVFPRLRDLL